jgi:1-acyl-sn-glycerol-3-phosphate acyltransferase
MTFIKLAIFILFTFTLAFLCVPALLLFFPWRKIIGPRILQFYSIVCLKIFRVIVEQADEINFSEIKSKGFILIPNHVSFLDIFLLSALYRTIYLSKIEVAYYPIVGQIAWLLIGIIFVDRSSHSNRRKVLLKIAKQTQGRVLTVFPQGTTGSIKDSLPFKRGIFKTVQLNHKIVLIPLTIHYKEEKKITWGKESLFNNVRIVCAYKHIHVKITVHERFTIKDYHGKTIPQISSSIQRRVLSELQKKY